MITKLFRTEVPGTSACVASPLIIYLDLLDGRGRNKELAQHVLEQLHLEICADIFGSTLLGASWVEKVRPEVTGLRRQPRNDSHQ